MVVESPAVLAREPPVELIREFELGAAARDGVLELFCERASGAEEERLECARREPEDLADLPVGPPFELPHHECLALALGDPLQRPDELLHRGPVVVGGLLGDIAVEHDLGRARLLLAEPLPHDVVRDRDQPVRRLARALAALEGAKGVDEGGLGDILGVGVVAEHGIGVAVHLSRMVPVEVVEGPGRGHA